MAVSPGRSRTWWSSGLSHATTCRSTSFLEAVSSDFSEFVDARVGPRGSLENLSQSEIDKLLDTGQGGAVPAVPPLRAGGAHRGGDPRQSQGNFGSPPRLEHPHLAPAWGVEARVAERP